MLKYLAVALLLATPTHADQYSQAVAAGNYVRNYLPSFIGGANVTPGTAPTDICVIGGSATKVVRIHQVQLTTTQSTAGSNRWFLLKRSNKFPVYTNQGATITGVPMSIPTVSSTASAITLSANASSLGTSVGNLIVSDVFAPVSSTAATGDRVIWNFDAGLPAVMPPTLMSATDTLAINFNGASLPSGLVVSCSFIWTEE